jgi:hypothetical protein
VREGNNAEVEYEGGFTMMHRSVDRGHGKRRGRQVSPKERRIRHFEMIHDIGEMKCRSAGWLGEFIGDKYLYMTHCGDRLTPKMNQRTLVKAVQKQNNLGLVAVDCWLNMRLGAFAAHTLFPHGIGATIQPTNLMLVLSCSIDTDEAF